MTTIDSRIGVIPSPIKKVLTTMFTTYQQVIVKSEFQEGFSGSRVFLVRPIRAGGRPELPSVVKIDDYERIEQEWEAFDDCIANQLPSIAQISDRPVNPPGSMYSGLRYPLAGHGAFDIIDLQTFCEKKSIDQIKTVLKDRLFKSLEKLWANKRLEPYMYFQRQYDSFLHPNLVIDALEASIPTSIQLRPDNCQSDSANLNIGDVIGLYGFRIIRVNRQQKSLVADMPIGESTAFRFQIQNVTGIEDYARGQLIQPPIVGRITQTRLTALMEQIVPIIGTEMEPLSPTVTLEDGRTLPNPLASLPEILQQSFDTYMACIHADLHMGNVLVEENGNIYMIDFVNSREDHVLRDFMNLELAIVTRMLPLTMAKENMSPQQIVAVYQMLHCNSRGVDVGKPPPALDKIFKILRLIRDEASHYLFETDVWKEYYYGLVIYFMGALRYADLDNIEGAKSIAFWAAATVFDSITNTTICEDLPREIQQSDKNSVEDPPPLSLDPPPNLVQIRNVLIKHFKTGELSDLMFELGIDYDDIAGNSRTGKARELVTFMDRRVRLDELINLIHKSRPDIDWYI